MKNRAYFKYTAILLGLSLGGFSIAFFISANTKKNITPPQKPIYEKKNLNTSDITDQNESSPDAILPCYLLKNENETLTLYEIYGEEKNVLKTVSINSKFFPPDDIQKLSNGIELSTLEEGFNIIADFSS